MLSLHNIVVVVVLYSMFIITKSDENVVDVFLNSSTTTETALSLPSRRYNPNQIFITSLVVLLLMVSLFLGMIMFLYKYHKDFKHTRDQNILLNQP